MNQLIGYRWLALALAVMLGSGCSSGGVSDKTDSGPEDSAHGDSVLDLGTEDLLPDQVPTDLTDLGTDDTDTAVTPDTVPDVGPDGNTWQTPALAGDLIITEFMAQSQAGVDPGEWFEIHNATGDSLELKDCVISDNSQENIAITESLVIAAGGYLVFGISADQALNNGLEPDYLLPGFALENSGDTIAIKCGDVEIDKVVFDSTWVLSGISRQLDPDMYDYQKNDEKANWCLAGFNYGGKGKLGTPGKENSDCTIVDPCSPNPCSGGVAPTCLDETTVTQQKVSGECTVEQGKAVCAYDSETEDCSLENKVCVNGACVEPPDPCDPNPCVIPPAPTCTDDIANGYEVPGVCVKQGAGHECSFNPKNVDCTISDKVCKNGACVYEGEGNIPVAGEVIVTEFMAKSQAGTDNGEWVELTNITNVYMDITGCTLKDKDSDTHLIAAQLFIPPMGSVVLARSGDPALNHGLAFDYIYSSFSLSNSDDEIILRCNNVEIDKVVYTSNWIVEGASTQLSAGMTDSVSNDIRENWCFSEVAYGTADKKGTPGLVNSECVIPLSVQKCRLQEPLDAVVEAGTEFMISGRATVIGVTDATTGNDPDVRVVGAAGYGPVGSNPATSALWTWVVAAPSAAWDGELAGEPEMDEYVATVSAPGIGQYIHAYRFSVDGGTTWTVCDRNAGAGSDGSEDGFQQANAGTLQTTSGPNPCEPNPCTNPPAASCKADGITAVEYIWPGACSVVNDTFECAYTEVEVNCGNEGKICLDGLCQMEGEGNLPDEAGEVFVTEFMARSQSGTDDPGEYVELYNDSASVIDLGGCELLDAGTNKFTFAIPTLLGPGEHLLAGLSSDTLLNHGITPDVIMTNYRLNNSGDVVRLKCGELVVDEVTYTGSVVILGASAQLNVNTYSAVENDSMDNWCTSTAEYGTTGKLGTPGLVNDECVPPPPPSVDWCRFQHPEYLEIGPGVQFQAYGRVSEQGLTTLSSGVDTVGTLKAEFGLGPQGSNPVSDPSTWTFTAASANAGWNDATAGEPGNDEYVASVTSPTVDASYDMAFRFSLDSGDTWVYCDLNKGEGLDGSEDGYSPANAGVLKVITTANPCDPNPCTAAPGPACVSEGTVARTYTATGATCGLVDNQPVCTWPYTDENCADQGKVCQNGKCELSGAGSIPLPGEFVLTEFMPRSQAGSNDPGEWVEYLNTATVARDLGGCSLKGPTTGTESHTITGTLVVAPGARVVLGVNADIALNHGVVLDYVYSSFQLNNSGDTIRLECNGQLIDSVVYTSGLVFEAYAVSLDPDLTNPVDNDNMSSWCPALSGFGTNSRWGTPKAANPQCPVAPVDWCRLQATEPVAADPAATVVFYGLVFDSGVTSRTDAVDTWPLLKAAVGIGPAGSDPAGNSSWSWTTATANPAWSAAAANQVNNDEYMASVVLTSTVGNYDFAFRFSLDNGSTWTYCDRNVGAGQDGSQDGYQTANAGKLTVGTPPNPCEPSPCTNPPAPDCMAEDTLRTFTALGATCQVVDTVAQCTYLYSDEKCAPGSVCLNSSCVPDGTGDAPDAGEFAFAEFMAKASSASVDAGEWIELVNVSAGSRDLSGCSITTSTPGQVLQFPAGTVVPSGGRLLLASSANAVDNFGLAPDLVWAGSMDLNDAGDTLTLDCSTVAIDVVTYTQTLVFEGVALSLDPDAMTAAGNDVAANWCPALGTYGTDGKKGSPDAANPQCPDAPVGWCRLNSPVLYSTTPGGSFDVYGLVYEADVTSRTDAVDTWPWLLAEIGVGSDNSDPAAGAGWAWYPAVANPAWNAAAANQGGNDEYMASLVVPSTPGSYDYAFRFSLDNGATWTYCDKNAGFGSDGSEDGYSLANAGDLVVQGEINPCNPNPCTVAPDDTCLPGSDTARLYTTVDAICTNNGGNPECTYAYVDVNCTDSGKVCSNGACVIAGTGSKPTAGEVIVTEFMAASISGSGDKGEWFEVTNVGTAPRDLGGCMLLATGLAEKYTIPGSLVIPAGGRLVFAFSGNSVENHGLTPDVIYGDVIVLNNSGDRIRLECDSVVIDEVVYDGTVVDVAVAASLNPGQFTAAGNDLMVNWCPALGTYGTAGKAGSPGAVNPACPPNPVDWCRLQFPDTVTVEVGAPFVVYGLVYEADVTTRSNAVDAYPTLYGQIGVGPAGSDPALGTSWSWFETSGNPAWDAAAANQANNDEYMGTVNAPMTPGTYDYAYRFSIDGGGTWTYCDRNVGSGSDGSQDGYSAANAGKLTVNGDTDPCDPNPCTSLPPAECMNSNTVARTYTLTGSYCSVLAGDPLCFFPYTEEDCSAAGKVCSNGACVASSQTPDAEGEVLITEYMPRSQSGIDEGEWFELYNAGTVPMNLNGCIITDVNTTPDKHTIASDVIIPVGGYAVLARSADVAKNHNLPNISYVYGAGYSLANSGDTIILRCGTTPLEIDRTSYPSMTLDIGKSYQLKPAYYNATDNNTFANWCLSANAGYTDGVTTWYATPGAASDCP